MEWSFIFFFNCILLGIGLAMDAFSVSMANGLNEPDMKLRKMCGIAGVFAGFQAIMPLAGWICVHTIIRFFTEFQKAVPWIALILLAFIGSKMLVDGIHPNYTAEEKSGIGITALLIQGIATSIDALSVGFTIAEYNLISAIIAAFIIATVTFVICILGLVMGKKFGTVLKGKAQIFGGIILIVIGLEIFITGII